LRPTLAIVPFSEDFAQGRLFSDLRLDRDGALEPWRSLAGALRADGWRVDTADRLIGEPVSVWLHLDAHLPPPNDVSPQRAILMMFEPEVVAPYWYRRIRGALPPFAAIYTHDRSLVARGAPFSYLHIPHSPPQGLLPQTRTDTLVMINARKYPQSGKGELYSERERVVQWFARHDRQIAVYGRGWTKADWRHPVFALRTPALRKVERGPVESKFDVLVRARFAVCFENMRSPGYISEKLFDCLACGAIPIYYGDPEITRTIPADAIVDYQRMRGPEELDRHLEAIDSRTEERMRQRGLSVLKSEQYHPFSIPAFVTSLTACIEEVAGR
jgi:alpha(1,3/1,4) fucosyltransferase